MSKILNVKENGQSIYDIKIERDYSGLESVLIELGTKGHRVCIVSDHTISGFYLNSVMEIVKEQEA